MAGEADAKTLEQRLRLIEDRFLEPYNLIASHPPSADTGASDYTASVWTEDGVFDRGAEFASTDRQSGDRRGAHQTLSTTGRSSRGSRISPGCLMCGSPAIRPLRFLICKFLCRTVSVRCSMSPTMVRHTASTCTAFQPIAGSSSALEKGWKIKSRRLRPLDGTEPALEIS